MNILITGAWQDARNHIEQIEAMGHTVKFMQWEKDPLPCEETWPEAVICNGLFQHHDLDSLTNLRYIQTTSAGLDRIPLARAKARNIEIHNARGVYSIPMAEYAVAAVLQHYKKLRTHARSQQQKQWIKQRSIPELYGSRVCIVGMGSVGTECARRFEAFGCTITGVDPAIAPQQPPAAAPQKPGTIKITDNLAEGLAGVDIIILTLPHTEETHHLIGARQLEAAPKHALWVNIARGGIIDQQALINHLRSISQAHSGETYGRGTRGDETCSKETIQGGAILDVFEEEPLPASSPLWEMDNVTITPHNSYAGEGNNARLAAVILANLGNALNTTQFSPRFRENAQLREQISS